ncbi:MAG: protein BatD [Proteobacteria bacterium]|nr:protein BatD [Pseudomonadota bacterium]
MINRISKGQLPAILIILFFLLPSSAFGALLNMEAYTDKTVVSMGDRLTLTIKISGEVSGSLPDPTSPGHEGFDIIGVPYQSSSFSWVNGRVSSSKTVNFTLIPSSEGIFLIGQSEVSYGGETITSLPVEVTVEKKEETTAPEEDKGIVQGMSADPYGRVIVSTSLSKKQVYVGEPLVYTFSFFAKVRLWENPEFSPPDFTDFWVENLPASKTPREVIIKGERYRREDIKKVLFPAREGDFTIDSTSITVQLDPFARPVVLVTDSIELEVFPLPAEPEDFKGAVGNFTIEASADKKKVKAGEPVTVKVKLAGVGNIKGLHPPVYEESELFRGYEPKDSMEISMLNDLISGIKTFEYLFIPLKEGEVTLPVFSLTFFDTAEEEYKTVKTKGMALTVLKGDESQAGLAASAQISQHMSGNGDMKKRLRPIRMKSSLGNWRPASYLKGLSLFLIILPPVIFLALLYSKGASRRKHQEQKASLGAAAALKIAEELMGEGKDKEFFAKTITALRDYLVHHFHLVHAGESKDELLEQLSKTNLPETVLQRIKEALEMAEVGRFAPTKYDETEMASFLVDVRAILEDCEKLNLKKGGSK